MRASDIASGAPTWSYVLLVTLIVLGIRRLRTRELPVVVALIPAAAFLVWSIVGVHAFASRAGAGLALSVWLAGGAVGAFTGMLLPEPRGERMADGRVRQPGSWLPLILYLGVFVMRFACGAWAAIVPEQAISATAVGLAVGAAMTARLVVGITRWRPASTR